MVRWYALLGGTVRAWTRFAPALIICVLVGALMPGLVGAQPPPIDPGSVQLRWDACYADGGADLKTFACDTNSGTSVLVVSTTLPVDLPQLNGMSATLLFLAADGTLPSWWQLGSGECRGSLLPPFIQSNFDPPAGNSGCIDRWQGGAAGGLNWTTFVFGNVAMGRARLVGAIPGSTSHGANQELFLARVLVRNNRTVGTGACDGCFETLGIMLEKVGVTQPVGVGDYHPLYPIEGTDSDFVSWQTPLAVASRTYSHASDGWHKDFTVTLPTEARRPTWGAVKAMYR